MVTNEHGVQTMVIIKTDDVLYVMAAIKPTSSWNIYINKDNVDKKYKPMFIYLIRVKWS